MTARKRGRPKGGRAFSHDEARRLRATGMTYHAIGEQLGASASSVAYACTKTAPPPVVRRREPNAARDAQWAALEAWASRRYGDPAGNAPSPIHTRRSSPRASA